MQNYNARYTPYRVRCRKPQWSKVKRSANYKKTWSPINKQSWQNSNNYREAYFRKNRGVLGMFYICSQCFKPMFNKNKIQIDHLIPPSSFINKTPWSNASSILLNSTLNLTATHPKCSLKRADKRGLFVLRGIIAKIAKASIKLITMLSIFTLYLALMILPLPFKLCRLALRKHTLRYRTRYSY